MKIWYQSFGSEEEVGPYWKVLREHLNSIAGPGVEIEIHGVPHGGIVPIYRFGYLLETVGVLRNGWTAQRAGYDAVVIGHSGDPGLDELREALDIPVLGITETSMLIASMLGKTFSWVLVSDKQRLEIELAIKRCGLSERAGPMFAMGVKEVAEIARFCFVETEHRERIVRLFTEAAKKAIDAGADILIPGAGCLHVFFAKYGPLEIEGVPILDGITPLIKMAEMMVTLRQTGRYSVSRKGVYASPTGVALAEIERRMASK